MRPRVRKLMWCPLVLAVACTGPGLEPPESDGLTPGAAGGFGAGAGAGAGGAAAGGTGGVGASAGTAAPPVVTPDRDGGLSTPDEESPLDGGTDAGTDGGTLYETQERVGPTYMGSVNNGADCSASYATRGHEPVSAASERHPLFLYFVGTAFAASDPSASHESPAALAVTEAMARRGFVALSVQYDNGALAWLSDHANQLACLFDGSKPASMIARACALPNVDCELGIATWGHSQGGYVAAMAYNHESRVRAAWATGYGGDGARRLPAERLRVVNGEADAADNGTAAKLNTITGLTPAQCPDADQCLRDNGSGWIIVRKADLAMPDTSTADHCWFDRPSCSASTLMLEPNWVDPHSDEPFALERNADWIASMLAAP